MVKELDAQGLLLRQTDPADGRSQRLTLTAAGRAACQRFRKHESAMAQRLFGPMPAHEIQALIDQLALLRIRLGNGESTETGLGITLPGPQVSGAKQPSTESRLAAGRPKAKAQTR